MQRTLFEDLHEDFRASFRTFLEREVLGEEHRYGEWERQGIIPREVYARAGAGGFLAMAAPEEQGGAGAEDFRLNLVIGEECQRAGAGSFGLGITLHNDICLPYFLRYCDAEQRQRWLPGIVSGELITALAMTEPGIGSDLAAMSTRAIRDDGHHVVDGSKTFITNGINADLVIIAAKTTVGGPQKDHRGSA
jgi:alkylation response protein AidB-like acyl-CoA dehydrogenase